MNEVQESPEARMRSYLQLVATGPELSKSLDQAQAEDAMTMILDNKIDPVRVGIFLIALRMKRETEAENLGVLKALQAKVEQGATSSAEVMVIADPFNGYLRSLPATPFLPAVFAACGLPAYIHGVKTAGPKYGITPHKMLAAAGIDTNHTVKTAVSKLDDPEIGWTYIDQASYIPTLHNLIELRDRIVKRTCLSTLEVILNPIKGQHKTHLMAGFVHKAYPPVYAMLAKNAGYDSAAIIRGVEGGCIPSLSQLSRYFGYHDKGELSLHRLTPKELDIMQNYRAVNIPIEFEADIRQTNYASQSCLDSVIAQNVSLGLSALHNQSGAMLDSLIYAAAIGLTHTGRTRNLAQGAEIVRKSIATGEALARFKAATTN